MTLQDIVDVRVRVRRTTLVAEALDDLIAAAIALGRAQERQPDTVDRTRVEQCRRVVLARAVPGAAALDPVGKARVA